MTLPVWAGTFAVFAGYLRLKTPEPAGPVRT
jgi:hypothetical protein